jgi:2-amino-4-hydroxy-6-hydroxymethyldihydropteridine diphosphokinase
MRDIAFIALGSNIGERERLLAFAREELAVLPATRVMATTGVEETAPLGGMAQPHFLNQMLAVETALDPDSLLDHLQEIERRAGRTRSERWGPRSLDLDIVLFGDRSVSSERLEVPHPGLADREFWQRQVVDLRRQLLARGAIDR